MKMLTAQDVAERLNITRDAVYHNWKRWRLPMIRVGLGQKARLRISEEAFLEWVEARRKESGESLAEDQARRMLKAVK